MDRFLPRLIKRKQFVNFITEMNTKYSKGFTLVECCIALIMTVIGLLASYSLMVYAVRNYSMSRDLVVANSLAKAKVEELSNKLQQDGGSLDNNVNGYFDYPSGNFVRRWRISSDSLGIKIVNVTIIPRTQGTLLPQVNIATRIQ